MVDASCVVSVDTLLALSRDGRGSNVFSSVCLYVCLFASLSVCKIFTSAKKVTFLPEIGSLSVCQQDNSKSYEQIFWKFSGNVGNGKNYQ